MFFSKQTFYSAVHGQYEDGPEQAVKDKKQKLQPQGRMFANAGCSQQHQQRHSKYSGWNMTKPCKQAGYIRIVVEPLVLKQQNRQKEMNRDEYYLTLVLESLSKRTKYRFSVLIWPISTLFVEAS